MDPVKIIPKHMLLKHAGLSLVLLCVPMLMPQGGLLGGIGFGMTLLGFLINLPGITILKLFGGAPASPYLMLPAMILLTELTVFVIPKYIIGVLRKKRAAKPSPAGDASTRADAGLGTPEE
jgi:membrane-bound ClpP family serine protease